MNIRQLEIFFWIARRGTFSAAAERLATSQANVSARIRELENELDVLLFDRIGRQVQRTVEGGELLVHGEKVVADAARPRLAAGEPDMVQGAVKIGPGGAVATSSRGNAGLPKPLRGLGRSAARRTRSPVACPG